jgi:hypothetical protein
MSPASVLTFRSAVHRASSARGSICISRRSRSIGTSVLTLAHVFARIAEPPRPYPDFSLLRPRRLRRFSTHVHTRV